MFFVKTMKKITLNIPVELYARLRESSYEIRKSMAQIIREAVVEYLDEQKLKV